MLKHSQTIEGNYVIWETRSKKKKFKKNKYVDTYKTVYFIFMKSSGNLVKITKLLNVCGR